MSAERVAATCDPQLGEGFDASGRRVSADDAKVTAVSEVNHGVTAALRDGVPATDGGRMSPPSVHLPVPSGASSDVESGATAGGEDSLGNRSAVSTTRSGTGGAVDTAGAALDVGVAVGPAAVDDIEDLDGALAAAASDFAARVAAIKAEKRRREHARSGALSPREALMNKGPLSLSGAASVAAPHSLPPSFPSSGSGVGYVPHASTFFPPGAASVAAIAPASVAAASENIESASVVLALAPSAITSGGGASSAVRPPLPSEVGCTATAAPDDGHRAAVSATLPALEAPAEAALHPLVAALFQAAVQVARTPASVGDDASLELARETARLRAQDQKAVRDSCPKFQVAPGLTQTAFERNVIISAAPTARTTSTSARAGAWARSRCR